MEARTEIYSDSQGTDEAVLLLIRKLQRLHPEAAKDLWSRLPDGARDALHMAEIRADVLRDQREKSGTVYTWPTDELENIEQA